MKIGIFTDAYYPQISGVVTSVMTLREELIKLGHEVYIITVSSPDTESIKDEEGIIRIKSIPFKKWKELRIGLPFYLTLKNQIKELNLDIIHTQTEFTIGMVGRRIAKHMGIPLVHTYHTMYVDYTHYIYSFNRGRTVVKDMVKSMTRSFLRPCCMAIAPTKKTKDALLSYGVKIPIEILPTGIDIKHFSRLDKSHPAIKELKARYSIEDDDKVLLFLGRVSEEKSIGFLVDAFPSILERVSNLKLLIVGDGPDKQKIEDGVRAAELQDKVIFTGMVKFCDVPLYYSLGDVFVNASQTETQGLTIMEAMAAGLPIVVYNDSNIAEHIKNDISGRLFNNQEEFVEAAVSALTDEEKNERLIEEGRGIIRSLSKENFARKMAELYEFVISNFCSK